VRLFKIGQFKQCYEHMYGHRRFTIMHVS